MKICVSLTSAPIVCFLVIVKFLRTQPVPVGWDKRNCIEKSRKILAMVSGLNSSYSSLVFFNPAWSSSLVKTQDAERENVYPLRNCSLWSENGQIQQYLFDACWQCCKCIDNYHSVVKEFLVLSSPVSITSFLLALAMWTLISDGQILLQRFFGDFVIIFGTSSESSRKKIAITETASFSFVNDNDVVHV